MSEEKVDYLDVDQPVNGQNYVCMSFLSPETMMDNKHVFIVSKFLQSVCKSESMDFDKIMSQYKDFTYKHEEALQKDFDEKNKFKTNIRGVKVRGVYQSKEEANARASRLHKTDSNFHVFVGQVGYWLPWDPCADNIEDEHFGDDQLNDLMQKYKENNVNKDIFYEDQKRDKIKASQEERLKKEKEKDDPIAEEPSTEEPSTEEPSDDKLSSITSVHEEPVGLDSTEQSSSSDLERALSSSDPWMQQKGASVSDTPTQ